MKALYAKHNIILEFVPANCTGELQPLDVSCNGDLKGYFSEWCANEVTKQLSVMKPLHASLAEGSSSFEVWESFQFR